MQIYSQNFQLFSSTLPKLLKTQFYLPLPILQGDCFYYICKQYFFVIGIPCRILHAVVEVTVSKWTLSGRSLSLIPCSCERFLTHRPN